MEADSGSRGVEADGRGGFPGAERQRRLAGGRRRKTGGHDIDHQNEPALPERVRSR